MKDHHDTAIELVSANVMELTLSDLNPRKEADVAGIERLAENIRAVGLIQNLAGIMTEDGTVEIVAGGRRLRALQQLQDDPRFATVPVRIAPDEATARDWAAAENHLREQLHPADEIAEYAALSNAGVSVPDIALAFGVREQQVYRRLALAGLPDAVLAALRADEISLAMAACFTLSNDDARSLDVLERLKGGAVSERQIKSWLQPEAVASSDRRARFVGADTYEAAGGRIIADLFGKTDYWQDPDILDAVFSECLATAAETAKSEGGWLWAEADLSPYLSWYELEARKCQRLYPEPGEISEDEAARLEELAEQAEIEGLDAKGMAELEALEGKSRGAFSDAQKAVSGVICTVDHEGQLQLCEGHVRPEERSEAIKSGVLAPSQHDRKPDGPRPVFSAALQRDLKAVERGARQSALLDHPDLLIDLLAFQLGRRAGFCGPLAIRTDSVDILPSTETGYDPDDRLAGALGVADTTEVPDPEQHFKRFRKQTKAKRQVALTQALAALIDVPGEALQKHLDSLVKLDRRSYWTPTAENLFGRLPGPYLDKLWAELLDQKPDHPSVTTFGRLKKREKAERLEELFGCEEVQDAHGLDAKAKARLACWWPDLDA